MYLDSLAKKILPHINAEQARAARHHEDTVLSTVGAQIVVLHGIAIYLEQLLAKKQPTALLGTTGKMYGRLLISRAKKHRGEKVRSIGKRKQ